MPGDAPYRLHEPLPRLHEPVLVAMLTGWIDASGAAAAALATVQAACATRPLATFDGDVFIDYRARRPTMELRDGVNERIVWPEIELQVGRSVNGIDVLVLTGPEPDSSWRRFAGAVGDLAVQMGVRTAVFMGAYPFASPHTRPARLSSSSPSPELVATLPFLKNSVDVPAGVSAVLEHALVDKDVPALGLWVQVPHYLGTMTYPAASVSLLEGLQRIAQVDVDTTVLRTEAAIQRERVDQLVSSNPEHQMMVSQLETLYDESAQQTFSMPPNTSPPNTSPPITSADIPSADELAAELERFLRDQTN